MDVSDKLLVSNFDWDPAYLQEIFEGEFDDFSDLWASDISDMELVNEGERIEKYSLITEDITLEDEELCCAVEKIKAEWVFCYCSYSLYLFQM